MTRPTPTDFRQKSKQTKKKRLLNTIYLYEGYSACSCGWDFVHKRKKVLDRATDAHAAKKHGNRVIYSNP